jgi:hypothetical protein
MTAPGGSDFGTDFGSDFGGQVPSVSAAPANFGQPLPEGPKGYGEEFLMAERYVRKRQ